ncbi:MAG: zinc-ribbon domain-containing protein [Oscillospiraceae bacterium]
MFCHKCGSQIAEGAEFCHKCGTMVTKSNIAVSCVFCPDTYSAAFAYDRKFVKAIGAKNFLSKTCHFICIKCISAMGTYNFSVHFLIPP